jgi:hypothetical protein
MPRAPAARRCVCGECWQLELGANVVRVRVGPIGSCVHDEVRWPSRHAAQADLFDGAAHVVAVTYDSHKRLLSVHVDGRPVGFHTHRKH